jgi:ABC-2 type transport system permease protein
MRALIHAELLKLRSTRTLLGLLVATLGLVALTVGFSVPKVGDKNAPVSLDDPHLATTIVAIGFGIPLVMAVLLGEIAFTQEFRYGTVTLTYLGEPRRARILFAKWLAAAASSVVITIATLALAVPFSIALIRSRDGEATLGTQFWQIATTGTVLMVVYGIVGVAIGALVRNQIAAVVGVLVWMLVVEQIVIQVAPSIGRWMPGGVTDALLQLGPSIGLDASQFLSTPVSWLLLIGYATAAAALALRFTPRRDVL